MTNTSTKTGPRLGIAGKLSALFAVSALCSYVAVAAVVSLHPPSNQGGRLRIPVLLSGQGDALLSGLQFDLNFDPTLYTLEAVEAGAAATDAGKNVVVSTPLPGQGRILVTGFNNANLFDGHVATLILRPTVAHATDHGFSVQEMLATDPFGNRVPLDYENAYDYPPETPTPDEDVAAESDTTPKSDPVLSDDPISNSDTPAEVAENVTESMALGGAFSNTDFDDEQSPPIKQRSASSTHVVVSSAGGAAISSPHPQRQARHAVVAGSPTRAVRQGGPTPSRRIVATTSNPTTPTHPADTTRQAESTFRIALAPPVDGVLADTPPTAGYLLIDEEPSIHFDSAPRNVIHAVLFVGLFCLFSTLNVYAYRWLIGTPWKRRP